MLSIIEGRVLGCLLEKERTTPDQYPLTLNALVLACNQSTSRDPVMSLEPHEVEAAIMSMKAAGLARLVHPSHGRSVTRYRQVASEHYDWDTGPAALMSVLLLRGPQTSNELRTRTERQHDFRSVEEMEGVLRSLAGADNPLVVQLERAPGQKELRWQQLLAEEPEHAPRAVSSSSAAAANPGLAERVDDLEARVARLEAALTAMAPQSSSSSAAGIGILDGP
jgi:uncharacterized protein YceH (UPF0502 family)